MTTQELAKKIRIHAVNMTHLGKSSHVGSVLSIADILAVLYSDILRVDPKNPKMENRDRFILSKGHAGAGVYATLAEMGFFSTDLLKTHYQNGSLLSGHVSHKGIPGVELSTGSLGHGLSVGTGLALGAKMDKKEYRTFVLLSDGECDEGSTWEAVLFAAHHKLDNLVAVVDYNKIQSLAPVNDTIKLEPFADKWKSFGWAVTTVDGHDHEDLKKVFASLPLEKSKPGCIIANTVKGKGVSFMENKVLWHYRTPQSEEYENAIKELNS
ncbi:MAG: transketolase [Bacteroidia bacterium]|nr:transketolase [Bacteroidia bacterium]